MQSTEEMYKDVTDAWRFIRSHSLPETDEQWEQLISEACEAGGDDDKALKQHLIVGFLNYLGRWANDEKRTEI